MALRNLFVSSPVSSSPAYPQLFLHCVVPLVGCVSVCVAPPPFGPPFFFLTEYLTELGRGMDAVWPLLLNYPWHLLPREPLAMGGARSPPCARTVFEDVFRFCPELLFRFFVCFFCCPWCTVPSRLHHPMASESALTTPGSPSPPIPTPFTCSLGRSLGPVGLFVWVTTFFPCVFLQPQDTNQLQIFDHDRCSIFPPSPFPVS